MKIDSVADVDSLATARNLAAADDGEIDRSPVMATVPTEPADIEKLRASIHANPLLYGTLVSEGDGAAAIFVTYEEMTDQDMVNIGVHARVAAALAELDGPEELLQRGYW